MKKLTLSALLLLQIIFLHAQNSEWEVGMFLGGINYQGDLIPKTVDISQSNVAIGLTSRYRYYYTLNFRANLIVGRISASDMDYPERESRGFSFQSSLIEMSGLAEWEPFGKERELKGGNTSLLISPYLMGGMGLAFINPKPNFPAIGNPGSQNPVIQDIRASYSKVQLVLPLGIGARYDINSKWTICAEIAGRVSFTDYLDGISIAANPGNNDYYWTFGLAAMFKPR